MEDADFKKAVVPEMWDKIDRIKELYNAPFARSVGMEIESITPDQARLFLDIRPEHINSRGFVHGAVIYALADHTLAFVANIDEEAVGQSAYIIYHRPGLPGRLESVATMTNRSKNLKVYDIRITENGKLIASSTFTAFRLGEKK
jgi:acyl-CoA thioesterase